MSEKVGFEYLKMDFYNALGETLESNNKEHTVVEPLQAEATLLPDAGTPSHGAPGDADGEADHGRGAGAESPASRATKADLRESSRLVPWEQRHPDVSPDPEASGEGQAEGT